MLCVVSRWHIIQDKDVHLDTHIHTHTLSFPYLDLSLEESKLWALWLLPAALYYTTTEVPISV